jgi:hypothetical protein
LELAVGRRLAVAAGIVLADRLVADRADGLVGCLHREGLRVVLDGRLVGRVVDVGGDDAGEIEERLLDGLRAVGAVHPGDLDRPAFAARLVADRLDGLVDLGQRRPPGVVLDGGVVGRVVDRGRVDAVDGLDRVGDGLRTAGTVHATDFQSLPSGHVCK